MTALALLAFLVSLVIPPVVTPLPDVTITDLSYDRADDDTERPDAVTAPPLAAPPCAASLAAPPLAASRLGMQALDRYRQTILNHRSRAPPWGEFPIVRGDDPTTYSSRLLTKPPRPPCTAVGDNAPGWPRARGAAPPVPEPSTRMSQHLLVWPYRPGCASWHTR